MRSIGWGVTLLLVASGPASSQAQAPSRETPETANVHKLSTTLRPSGAKGLACSEIGVETGDPATGRSIVVEKFAPGCTIPWHWHTPNEHVMMVSGTFRFQMKGEKPVRVERGDFVFMPSHHISQTTCIGPDSCIDFLYTDGPFDVHFVDETGKEISLDQALKNQKKALPHPKQN